MLFDVFLLIILNYYQLSNFKIYDYEKSLRKR